MSHPIVILSRDGVDVIRDEAILHPVIQKRFTERRKHKPEWWACNGAALGVSVSYLAVAVDGSSSVAIAEWMTPSGLMAVVAFLTMVFALGQMWNARQEDQRRITKIEENIAENYVTKDTFTVVQEAAQRVEAKIDRIIERIHLADSR